MFFPLFLVIVNSKCPQVFCGKTTDPNYCVQYSNSSSIYNIQQCNNTNYTAPHPSHYSQTYPLACEYWVDSKYWQSSSWQEYYGYVVLGNGESCDPYGIVSVCNTKDNLVCYCQNNDCKCTKGLQNGVECDNSLIPCIPGFICSSKICTQMYSLNPGDKATNSLACIGGGPLIITNNHFVCRQGPKTVGVMPKKCSTNNDCISDTGTDITQCVCGLNTDGQAYCTLHFGDSPMVNWRNAQRDGQYKLEIYWKFVSVNYPYLQGNIDSCMGNVWRDFYQYMNGQPSTTQSWAINIAFGGILVIVNI